MIVDDEQNDPDGGFDPRYDPQFQRGYRPQPGERARTRLRAAPPPAETEVGRSRPREGDGPSAAETAAEAAAVPLTAVPLPAVPLVRVAPAAAAEEVAGVVDPVAEHAGVVRAYAVPAPSLLDRIDLSPRRNPLILTLWLVGAGLVVLGIVLYSVSVSLSYTGSTPSTDVGSLVISQLGWMLAGPMITVGLATLVGLLFLTALAGRRPGGAPRPEHSEHSEHLEHSDRSDDSDRRFDGGS